MKIKKRFVYLITILLITSCKNSNQSDKYNLINVNEDKKLDKIEIDVRLKKEVNKIDLKKIGSEIKNSKPEFENYWIYYYLPEHKIGNGAWAVTHFNPDLEIEILGATKNATKEMDEIKVSGQIIKEWKDNDAIMPNKIYLVKESEKLFMKTVYAKNKYTDAEIIVNEVTQVNDNGLIRYNYENNHGDYYKIEKNGNLGLYNDNGKFKEAIK